MALLENSYYIRFLWQTKKKTNKQTNNFISTLHRQLKKLQEI